jgi:hypothetical protein
LYSPHDLRSKLTAIDARRHIVRRFWPEKMATTLSLSFLQRNEGLADFVPQKGPQSPHTPLLIHAYSEPGFVQNPRPNRPPAYRTLKKFTLRSRARTGLRDRSYGFPRFVDARSAGTKTSTSCASDLAIWMRRDGLVR